MLEGCHRLRNVKDLRTPKAQPVLAALCEALNSVCSYKFETTFLILLHPRICWSLQRK